MLIGYVSDERYVALADVAVEFTNEQGESWETRSRAGGSIHCDLPPGDYTVTLAKPGFGSKRVRMTPQAWEPHQIRLRSDTLGGCAWPECVRSGEECEFRVHSVEPYKIELWRYGWQKEFIQGLGWHDEHGPRAVMQSSPNGDYTQVGVQWNKVGYLSRIISKKSRRARSGLYIFMLRQHPARLHVSLGGRAAKPTAPIAVLASNITWNAYQFRRPQHYISADETPTTPTINSRQELKRYTDANHQTWGATPTLRYPLSGRSRSIISIRASASRIRLRAEPPIISRPRNGACSVGSNAKVLRMISTAKRSFMQASLIYPNIACSSWVRIRNTGHDPCTTMSKRGSSNPAAN